MRRWFTSPAMRPFWLLVMLVVLWDVTIRLAKIPPYLIPLARSMGANPLKVFLKFRLPTALPSIFSGLKVSVTLAVVGAVVGEFVGSNSGIGYVLQKANGTFDLPLMFAALVILSMVGVLLFLVIELIERWLMPWHASQRIDVQLAA